MNNVEVFQKDVAVLKLLCCSLALLYVTLLRSCRFVLCELAQGGEYGTPGLQIEWNTGFL